MGVPYSLIKFLKSNFPPAKIAEGFAFTALSNYPANYAGMLFTATMPYSSMGGYVAGLLSNATHYNLASFVPGGSPLATGAAAALTPSERIQLAISGFQSSSYGAGYIPLGIVGNGNGFVSQDVANRIAGLKTFAVCFCSDCKGFLAQKGHQAVIVAMVPNTSENALISVPIEQSPYLKQPVEIGGPTFKKVDIKKDCPNCDDCVNPPCDSRIEVGLALAAFAIKRIIEAGKTIEDMHISTHIRGNMARDNGFDRINPTGMLQWWNPYNNPGQYDPALSANEVIVSKKAHGSTYASAQPYLPPPFYQNQYEPEYVAHRSGVPYYPTGIPLSVQEKVVNNEEHFIDDVFTVTHYIDFCSTDNSVTKDYYYDIVKKMLGTSSWYNAQYPHWAFWLDFSDSPGYAYEQEFTAQVPGRWERPYKDEWYNNVGDPIEWDVNGNVLRDDAYGNKVAINGSSGIPTYIVSFQSSNSPPSEYPSYNDEPTIYYWSFQPSGEAPIVDRDVYFDKGYRLRYRNIHSPTAYITYLGEQSKETRFTTTSNVLKDYAGLLTSIFATALGPPGWITTLANLLLSFLPPLNDIVTRWAEHHHFAVQFNVPYRLYYGAWTTPGQLEIKPKIGWGSRIIASKVPEIPIWTGSVSAYPVGHRDAGVSGTIGEKYQWLAELDGQFELKNEINWPSNYYLTKTTLNLPSYTSGTIQVLKGEKPNEVQMVSSGGQVYGFPIP